jgi:hypothetical protein
MIGMFIFGQHNKGKVKQSKEQKVTDFIEASLMTSESDRNYNNASLHACSNPPSIISMSS